MCYRICAKLKRAIVPLDSDAPWQKICRKINWKACENLLRYVRNQLYCKRFHCYMTFCDIFLIKFTLLIASWWPFIAYVGEFLVGITTVLKKLCVKFSSYPFGTVNQAWRGKLHLEFETLFFCTLIDICFMDWTTFWKFEALKSAKQFFLEFKVDAHSAAGCDCSSLHSHPDNAEEFIIEPIVRSANAALILHTEESFCIPKAIKKHLKILSRRCMLFNPILVGTFS